MKTMMMMGLMGAASLALGACASSGPVPAARLAKSEAAVRSAQEVGAQQVPPAAIHLRVANDELAMAKQLIIDGENKRADYILMRAEADANAALSLTRETQARNEAQRTLDEVQKLRNTRPEGT
jgi:hypothetical protein